MKVLPKRTNKTDDWLTPPELVRSLGGFDLDPCGSVRQSGDLAATVYRLPESNGLLLPWHGRVWCNPPFSQMKAWVNRFTLHTNGIMICPARIRVQWARPLWETADAILYLKESVRWISQDGVSNLNDLFDFMLVGYGPANTEALRWSGLAGTLVTTRECLPLKKDLTSPPDEVESSHGHEIHNTGNRSIHEENLPAPSNRALCVSEPTTVRTGSDSSGCPEVKGE